MKLKWTRDDKGKRKKSLDEREREGKIEARTGRHKTGQERGKTPKREATSLLADTHLAGRGRCACQNRCAWGKNVLCLGKCIPGVHEMLVSIYTAHSYATACVFPLLLSSQALWRRRPSDPSGPTAGAPRKQQIADPGVQPSQDEKGRKTELNDKNIGYKHRPGKLQVSIFYVSVLARALWLQEQKAHKKGLK